MVRGEDGKVRVAKEYQRTMMDARLAQTWGFKTAGVRRAVGGIKRVRSFGDFIARNPGSARKLCVRTDEKEAEVRGPVDTEQRGTAYKGLAKEARASKTRARRIWTRQQRPDTCDASRNPSRRRSERPEEHGALRAMGGAGGRWVAVRPAQRVLGE